jgi:group I intron endonuclease
MKYHTVYMHITPNGKRYIGITCKKPERRWNNGKAYEYNKHFYNAILKYGWENIEHIIIAEGLTKEEAGKMEIDLIQKYNCTNPDFEYNRSTGGEWGGIGVVFTEERKQKISKAITGKRHTEVARRKMSEGHKGKPSWNKGRKWSDQEKKVFSRAQKTSKPILCVETNIVYNGTREAHRETGINRDSIKDCLHQRPHCKTAGGYHWQYV